MSHAKFKCDALATLACHSLDVASLNSCECAASGDSQETMRVSFESAKQKNEFCNRLSAFGISSFVDVDGACRRDHETEHQRGKRDDKNEFADGW